MKYSTSRKNTQAITKNVKMYGKLSVVMGLTWLLGFFMKYSVILKFMYLVANNLQGKNSLCNIITIYKTTYIFYRTTYIESKAR